MFSCPLSPQQLNLLRSAHNFNLPSVVLGLLLIHKAVTPTHNVHPQIKTQKWRDQRSSSPSDAICTSSPVSTINDVLKVQDCDLKNR
ncbi:hypothetical protein HanXRQr2_Chr12g0534251 [Helianthus annuus]|uniref:Uncharacterized protein n=1 Tax=Helianthus annuus TaxID=4232 RepID=A0A251UBK8_HELAN|nr:hypothetical protein HanXRQr2_Chr12g0534251 [Helianthus annuus]KAJ0488879.1 hypothetical protein HanHA300_Chr12g0437771 [Helianthus annuus]KAJ0504719.1 hypothetical protein HanHA89_Chr12g0462431 [Helianthus annuus]KAJ0674451.1 hypothetical protein HanLR1_Chr12g0440111 [Helianthus annuus]KAJ0862128.1 hypothetical protein HanPSC8_Chr12g0514541 [Helianthus annuus]